MKKNLTILDAEKIIKCLPFEKAQVALRQIREKECYEVINRGELWYSRLTSQQKQELNAWYEDWLNVTVTLKVPIRPIWLR